MLDHESIFPFFNAKQSQVIVKISVYFCSLWLLSSGIGGKICFSVY